MNGNRQLLVLLAASLALPSTALDDAAGLWEPCTRKQKHLEFKPVGDMCLQQNLFYIKIYKTGSSTLSGIMRRIGAKHGLAGVSKAMGPKGSEAWGPEPHVTAHHVPASMLEKAAGSLSRRIIRVASVRDPTSRALSAYNHFGIRTKLNHHKQVTDTADYLIQYLRKNYMASGSLQQDYLLHELRRGQPIDADEVVSMYDLILVNERLEESLVALKHTLGLPSLCDVLFTSSKAGHTPYKRKDEQPQEVKSYLASEEYLKSIAPDKAIHQAANLALDRVVADIGPRFEAELALFRRLVAKASEECQNGKAKRECMWRSMGCFTTCLDNVCKNAGIAER